MRPRRSIASRGAGASSPVNHRSYSSVASTTASPTCRTAPAAGATDRGARRTGDLDAESARSAPRAADRTTARVSRASPHAVTAVPCSSRASASRRASASGSSHAPESRAALVVERSTTAASPQTRPACPASSNGADRSPSRQRISASMRAASRAVAVSKARHSCRRFSSAYALRSPPPRRAPPAAPRWRRAPPCATARAARAHAPRHRSSGSTSANPAIVSSTTSGSPGVVVQDRGACHRELGDRPAGRDVAEVDDPGDLAGRGPDHVVVGDVAVDGLLAQLAAHGDEARERGAAAALRDPVAPALRHERQQQRRPPRLRCGGSTGSPGRRRGGRGPRGRAATRAAVAPSARAAPGGERAGAGERLPVDPGEQAHGQVGAGDRGSSRSCDLPRDATADGVARPAVRTAAAAASWASSSSSENAGFENLSTHRRGSGVDEEVAILLAAELGDARRRRRTRRRRPSRRRPR